MFVPSEAINMIYPNQVYLTSVMTNQQRSLADLSAQQPVLLVFLRHFGCTFCREALADLSALQEDIEALGARLVFVHMSDHDTANRYFERFDLTDAEHISDVSCELYRVFGLTKGTPRQLFGLQSWIRGFEAGVMNGLGVGPQLGDGFQMPGVFVIKKGVVTSNFVHQLASDRPVYLDLLRESC